MPNNEIIAEMKKGFRDVKIFYYGQLHSHSELSEGNEIRDIEIVADKVNLLDKARAEGRKEFICRNCADIWNVDTSDEFEAGRQFERDNNKLTKHALEQALINPEIDKEIDEIFADNIDN